MSAGQPGSSWAWPRLTSRGHNGRSVDIANEYPPLERQPLWLLHGIAPPLCFPQRRLGVLLLPVRRHLLAAQHHLFKQEDVVVSWLVRLGDSKVLVEEELAELYHVVSLPILDATKQVVDDLKLCLLVRHVVDLHGDSADGGCTFFELGTVRVVVLGSGIEDSL
jgi:hypothetical protein